MVSFQISHWRMVLPASATAFTSSTFKRIQLFMEFLFSTPLVSTNWLKAMDVVANPPDWNFRIWQIDIISPPMTRFYHQNTANIRPCPLWYKVMNSCKRYSLRWFLLIPISFMSRLVVTQVWLIYEYYYHTNCNACSLYAQCIWILELTWYTKK